MIRDDSLVLGQLAEEFTTRVRQRQLPSVEDYAAKHPELAERIRALFPTLLLLEGLAAGQPDGSSNAASPAPADLGPGVVFGNYRIEREIGRGGMGAVYEATHLALDKRVALKVLPIQGPRQAGALERFLREARTAAGLHHTNIVPVFDVGQAGGIPYYAMQFIDGRGLDKAMSEMLATSTAAAVTASQHASPASAPTQAPNADEAPVLPLPTRPAPTAVSTSPEYFRRVAEWGIQVAQGLHYAHQRGVIHRDIKPSNLILDRENVLWIADFGLARRLEDPSLTHTGAIVGTPRYMSPEQAEAARTPIDHRTDIYSLGATLYELLTCRPAFDGPTPLDIVMQIISRDPPSPRELNKAVPRDLETIVEKAMARHLSDRYQTAVELADDLQRYLKLEPIKARRTGPVGRTVRWCRRNPVVASLLFSIAVLTLVPFSIYYWSLLTALAGEREARKKADENLELADRNLREANAERARAEKEGERAQDHLCRGLFEQAKSSLGSTTPGRRWQVLELLKEAERLRSRQRTTAVENSDLPTRAELRSAAAAALLLPDARCLLDSSCMVENGFPVALNEGPLAGFVFLDLIALKCGWRLFDLEQAREIGYMPLIKSDDLKAFIGALFEMGSTVASNDGLWFAFRGSDEATLLQVRENRSMVLKLPVELRSGKVPSLSHLTFSPDNRYLAALHHHDKKAQLVLWNVKTQEVKAFPLGEQTPEIPIAFSRSGKLAACASGPKKVALWNLDTLTKAAEVELPDEAWRLTFTTTDDALGIQCGKTGNTWALWSHRSGALKKLMSERTHLGHVSPSGKYLLIRGYDKKQIVLQEFGDPARSTEIELPIIPAYHVFSPDERLLAVSCGRYGGKDEPMVVLWNLEKNVEQGRFLARDPGFMALSPDGSRLALSHGKGNISVVDVRNGKEIYRLTAAHKEALVTLAWQSDGRRLTSVADGSVKLWEFSPPLPLAPFLSGTDDSLTRYIFSPDGKWLALHRHIQKVELLNRASGKVEREWWLVNGQRAPYFSPDGKKLLIWNARDAIDKPGQLPNNCLLIDLATGREEKRVDVHESVSVAMTPDHRLLIALQSKDGPQVRDVYADRLLWQGPREVKNDRPFLSPDGAIVALDPDAEHPGSLWDVASGRKLAELGPNERFAGPFAPDSRRLVLTPGRWGDFLGLSVRRVPSLEKIVDVPSENQLTEFGSHAFSLDSRLLIHCNSQGTITFYDVERGGELLRWRASTKTIPQMAFTPEGDLVCAANQVDAARILHLGKLRRELAELGLDW